MHVYGDILNTVWSAEKVFKLLDRKPDMQEAGDWIPEKLDGRITFDNVTLSYPSRSERKALEVTIILECRKVVRKNNKYILLFTFFILNLVKPK